MRTRAVLSPLVAVAAIGTATVLSFAQDSSGSSEPKGTKPAPAKDTPVQTAIMDFSSKVGSFKILSPSSEMKARGALTMNFQGTVLIVGLEGQAVPGGSLREEYNDPKQNRRAYFGKGSLKINGKWRAIQFFGRDFSGRWDGYGLVRLYGEFDDKLETGTYKIQGQEAQPWGNGGRTVALPPPNLGPTAKPKVVDVPKKPG